MPRALIVVVLLASACGDNIDIRPPCDPAPKRGQDCIQYDADPAEAPDAEQVDADVTP